KEPKETSEPKRTRALPCPEPGLSDGENESESSPLPMRHGPALVNGRGPLDGFMSHSSQTSPAKIIVVVLTEDFNSTDPLKQQPGTPISASCPSTKNNHQSKTLSAVTATKTDHTAKTGPLDCKVGDEQDGEEEQEGEDTASISQLDTTQGSDIEEESVNPDMSSHGNGSMLSPSSTSSLSAAESSPEAAKTENNPTVVVSTDSQIRFNKHSMSSLQEQEERLHQRQERERQREEAKAVKEKKKEEARKLKEERERERKEKREKEEREKRERKEKEEKEKAEKLRAKEEHRKSKLKAEKAEITRFLQKPKTPQQATKTLVSACGKFAPFEIKEHMGLAPLTRVQCEEAVLDELDRYLAKPDGSLHGLRDWTRNEPRRSGPTKPRSTDSMRQCIVIVKGPKPDGVPDRQRYGRMKLLQFRENYRPAYWGTWSKKSPHISPRYPLRQDKVRLSSFSDHDPSSFSLYDNDEGGENDDDDEDGFFVPHGYLSDGEGALEEEEGGDPEKQKVHQKLKAREWDELMAKKKVKVLEAVVRGCVWEGEGPPLELFQQFAVCLVEPLPKPEPITPEDYAQKLQQKLQEDEQLLSQLLPLLHGNVNSNKVIITEFQEFCRQKLTSTISSPKNSGDIPTRIRLKRLIKGNAMYEKRSAYRRCCWYIHTEVLVRFSQEALPVPCQWNYLTSGAHVSREEASAATGSQGNSPTTPQTSTTPSSSNKTPSSSNKRKSAGSMSITKFMKKAANPEQAHEMDGFQADTEEDEDEADCVIIRTQKGETSK
uniref:Chromatin assembly factor 1, subunit A (p150) n=1 Tax=Salmo trutta TaxID=8032 RepID=A0A673WJD3_SALTR